MLNQRIQDIAKLPLHHQIQLLQKLTSKQRGILYNHFDVELMKEFKIFHNFKGVGKLSAPFLFGYEFCIEIIIECFGRGCTGQHSSGCFR